MGGYMASLAERRRWRAEAEAAKKNKRRKKKAMAAGESLIPNIDVLVAKGFYRDDQSEAVKKVREKLGKIGIKVPSK